MKCLSLHQPGATLLTLGAKRYETRSWRTEYRGPLLIHASVSFPPAARFSSEAFAADPKLADDQKAGHRYNAACYAALAGCGQGRDADKVDDKEKARLRRQALDRLQADLAAWTKQVQSHQSADRAVVRQTLQHWKADPDLAGVRGNALAQLPQAERPPWQKLWADVDALLAAVSAPETKR
jgi:eukaryotic-like serine/threonine-protein kinase